MTSLIRFVVPSSMPFISEAMSVSGPIEPPHSARLARRVWAGTASTAMAAPSSASAGSRVAVIVSGRIRSGR